MREQQIAWEQSKLGAYYRQLDEAERLACAVESELETLFTQTLGDLIRHLPAPWKGQLEDVCYEIAEALVQQRRRQAAEEVQ